MTSTTSAEHRRGYRGGVFVTAAGGAALRRQRGEARLGPLTALVGVGYFFVWTVLGMAAFPLGVALAAVEMRQPALARAVPIAVGVRSFWRQHNRRDRSVFRTGTPPRAPGCDAR